MTHACMSSWQLLDWMHRKFRSGEPLKEFSAGMPCFSKHRFDVFVSHTFLNGNKKIKNRKVCMVLQTTNFLCYVTR